MFSSSGPITTGRSTPSDGSTCLTPALAGTNPTTYEAEVWLRLIDAEVDNGTLPSKLWRV